MGKHEEIHPELVELQRAYLGSIGKNLNNGAPFVGIVESGEDLAGLSYQTLLLLNEGVPKILVLSKKGAEAHGKIGKTLKQNGGIVTLFDSKALAKGSTLAQHGFTEGMSIRLATPPQST